jgi:hypothetical protein
MGQPDRIRRWPAGDVLTTAGSARDQRVLGIKVADRLHNMRTLGYLCPDLQERKSREVLEFFAPLLHATHPLSYRRNGMSIFVLLLYCG